MDGRRFDDLSRTLTGTTRRGILRGMAGGVLAGTLVLHGARGAEAQVESAARRRRGEWGDADRDCCGNFGYRRGDPLLAEHPRARGRSPVGRVRAGAAGRRAPAVAAGSGSGSGSGSG